jgi:hypothetical protein
MSGVFRNIDPPPPHRPVSVYPPPPLVRGEDTLAGWREGGGSTVRKIPDTALYSIYTSTLWSGLASSEILTPPPRHRPASVYPSAFGAGGEGVGAEGQ